MGEEGALALRARFARRNVKNAVMWVSSELLEIVNPRCLVSWGRLGG